MFENKVSWLLAGARGVKSCMCSIVCSFVRVLEKPLHIPVEINRGIRVAIEAVYELRCGVKRGHVEVRVGNPCLASSIRARRIARHDKSIAS